MLALVLITLISPVWAVSISVDTTWQAGDQYFTENIDIQSGATLTIEAGAILHFSAGNMLQVLDGGKLIISGDGTTSVLLTSDTATKGGWYGISINGERTDASDIQINYAIIEFADRAVQFEQGSKGSISNSILRDSNYGVYFNGKRTGGAVSNSDISNNNYGIYVHGAFSYLIDHPSPVVTDNNIFDNANYNYYVTYFYDRDKTVLSATGNWWGSSDLPTVASKIYDLIDNPSWGASIDYSNLLLNYDGSPTSSVLQTSSVSTDTTWNGVDGVLAQPINVNNGATLTIASGTSIEAIDGSELIVNDGAKIIIQGTDVAPVIITNTTMLPGSWKGIQIQGERATTDDIQINFAIIEYAINGMKFEQGAKGDITNSILRNNTYGVYYNGKRTGGLVTSSDIYDNQYGIYVHGAFSYLVNHPTPLITGNNIFDNTSYGYYSTYFYDRDKTNLNASGNWWGTTDLSIIASHIYDIVDNPSWSPSVDFSGVLDSVSGSPIQSTFYTSSITQDTIWSATDGMLAQPINISNGATLTILAGTIINAATNSEIIINGGAKLLIQGTQAEPVIFSGQGLAKGSWKGITVQGERLDSSNIQIDNTVIEYATYGVKYEQGSKGNITNSVFHDNTYGIYYNGKRTGGSVTSSDIYDNQYGVYVHGGFSYLADHPVPVVTGNNIYNNTSYNYYGTYFYDRDKTALNAVGNWWGNDDLQAVATSIYGVVDNPSWSPSINFSGALSSINGVAIPGTLFTSTIIADTNWSATDGILAQPINIANGVRLTISANTQINAGNGSELIVNDGASLFIEGTELEPVVFTSTGLIKGSWKGLTIQGERPDSTSIQINNALIEYATYGVKYEQGSKGDITNSTVRGNTHGVYYNGKRTGGTVSDSAIYDNQYGIYVHGGFSYLIDHPAPVTINNSIYNNSSYNFYTTYFYDREQVFLNATNNWWGTIDLTSIAASVYDINDNPSWSPSVDYRQMLQADGGEVVSGNHILGNISGEVRWQSFDSLVLATTRILDGAHLIIEAGSNIKFAKNTQLIVNKNAQLTIVGDDNSPVVLTSEQQTRVAGGWKGIQIDAESGDVIISNTIIEYADKGLYISGKKAKAIVTQSTIRNNNYGVFVNGGNVALADHPVPVITNSEISDNVNYNYYTQSFSSGSSRTLNAKGNYWGSSDPTVIAQNIYDNTESGSSPIVDYGFARISDVNTVTANAGAATIGFGTVETLLSGTGTSNVAITNYAWQQYLGSPVTLVNANASTARFTVPDAQSEQLISFTFTVTDANDISATDKLNVVIKPFSEFNQAPVVDQSQEILVTGGEAVSVTLAASDGDNDSLSYSWQQVSGEPITLAATNTNTLAFTAPSNTKNKAFSFKLTVTDGNYTVERTVVVAVKAPETIAGTYYYHNDHLGTPQVMTDTNATVVWQANYMPFGKADIVVENFTNNIRFPGQYFDQESGLHYNYFRDYDPELGRYIQSDPIGLAGGINTYGYALGNPISYTDPYGLDILLQTHHVRFGNNHSKVTVIIEPNSKWKGDPRFSNQLPDGRTYGTFGAGPSGFLAFGNLRSDMNRGRDKNLSHNNYSQSIYGDYCPSQDYEDNLIGKLLSSDMRFNDSKFDYELFPGAGEYNSNSYANGLLRSIGVNMPAPPSTTGFNQPVPIKEFR